MVGHTLHKISDYPQKNPHPMKQLRIFLYFKNQQNDAIFVTNYGMTLVNER